MGYTKDIVKGISWVGLFRLISRIMAYGRIVVLARILSPAQFGVYGIATVVLEFFETLTETGVNVILMQEKDDIKPYINSAWIVSIFRGFIIGAVILVSASFISNFFRSKDAFFILMLTSIVPVVRGFINPAVVKFQKELEFRKEFIYNLSIFVVYSVAAIILAVVTRSALSLVVALIISAIFEVLVSFFIIKPRPIFLFEKKYILIILSRGKWVTANGILNYLFQNTDDIVVGRFLGAPALGLYQMAHKLATIPISEVADVLGKVTFPVFVKISNDTQRLKSAFIKTTLGSLVPSIVIAIILIVFSETIILVAFGKDWLGIVEVIKFLAIYGVLRTIINPALTVFLAVKKQEIFTLVSFISFLGLIIFIFPLVFTYGIVGAGIAAVVASILSFPIVIYYTIKVLKN